MPTVPSARSKSVSARTAPKFVFQPIAHWAERTPDAVAILARDLALTYRELEQRTNQIAQVLSGHGVVPGDRVAFVLPRGPKTILLLIGILKAGAAYVPLDSESPLSRIRDCLEDAQPKLVIAEDGHAALQLELGASWLTRSEVLATAHESSDVPLSVSLSSADLAYIIFTSGTTGRPKGVPITHAALTNFVLGDQDVCIQVRQEDRVLQAFSPASDGHHEEVWPTFLAGATLVVASSREVYSGPEFADFLDAHAVTVVSCAPTLLAMVERDVPSLRRILFGAENCPAALVKRWSRPGREILNTYGPTEASVGATFSICLPDAPITIGKPLPGYFCYVVDEALTLVPDGEEGELAIAGVGVATGYFAREELSIGKFCLNPYALDGENNATLYRTGDRVRRNENGDLVWLGRVDAQVKVRGHRIELSEIESHIVEHSSVQSTVVVNRPNEDGEAYLVALLVPRSDAAFDVSGVLSALRDALPAYMVPQGVEQVDAIPRLPSGKVDRRACQLLHGQIVRIEREIVPPRTASEKLVLSAWTQLFPDQEISSTDDFFRDLGGYSLLASKFISILRQDPRFAGVSVLDIYEHPTIRAFAAVLDDVKQLSRPMPEFKAVPAARYRWAKFWQMLGVLFLYGIQGFFWLGPIIAAIYFSAEIGFSDWTALCLGILFHAASVPLLLVVALVIKWTVGARFKPGSYPMWGATYLRWWFVHRMLAIAPVSFLTGTPLAAWYLRLLGAKVGRNVDLEAFELDTPDLIEIGDDCTLENSAWLHPAEVAHGELHLRPIKLGKGCSLGVRAGVAGGGSMGDGACLRDLTCVTTGMSVPAGEEWAGSVAAKVAAPVMPPYDPAKQPSSGRGAWFGALQTVLVLVLSLLDSLPFVTVAFMLYNDSEGWHEYLYLEPVYAIGLVLFAATQVLIIKWLVQGKLKPGTYPFPGATALRKWFADKHLELGSGTIVPIYDSLFARPWCMLLGMKCGPRCEIALPRRMPYDLVSMGEESFLASEVSIGRPIRRNGTLYLERTEVGRRSFLGNDSVVPQGTNVPDEFLLGVLSVAPRNEQIPADQDQAWLGSPPFRMPSRQVMDQFEAARTYRPTAKLYAQRLAHETVRAILPSLCALIIAAALIESFTWIWNEAELGWALASVPVLYLAGTFIGAAMCWISKRILIGKYRPTIQPLWSQFVWKTETHSAVLHDFAAPMFMTDLIGTPFLSGFMRFLGAKVGHRVFWNSTDWTETDLIEVGDDVAVNANAPLQAHLFEDRVMKVGPIKVGERCAIGTYSVVLCESEIKHDAHIGHLSLVMKGETIPAGTFWAGSPAQSVEELPAQSKS